MVSLKAKHDLAVSYVNLLDSLDRNVALMLKKVLRQATKKDLEHLEENKAREKEAMKICEEKIRNHNLDMKLVDVEYTFDNSKILFYFTSDGRVDFRQLVKDLATVFRTRIELRQIGVRDEAKMLGKSERGETPVRAVREV